MGRIVAQVGISNPFDKGKELTCSMFVDTDVTGLILPLEWKTRLGEFPSNEEVELLLANNETIKGEACGPVGIQMEKGKDGESDPLLGYVILEQSQIAVDMVEHRLVPVKYMDCK